MDMVFYQSLASSFLCGWVTSLLTPPFFPLYLVWLSHLAIDQSIILVLLSTKESKIYPKHTEGLSHSNLLLSWCFIAAITTLTKTAYESLRWLLPLEAFCSLLLCVSAVLYIAFFSLIQRLFNFRLMLFILCINDSKSYVLLVDESSLDNKIDMYVESITLSWFLLTLTHHCRV